MRTPEVLSRSSRSLAATGRVHWSLDDSERARRRRVQQRMSSGSPHQARLQGRHGWRALRNGPLKAGHREADTPALLFTCSPLADTCMPATGRTSSGPAALPRHALRPLVRAAHAVRSRYHVRHEYISLSTHLLTRVAEQNRSLEKGRQVSDEYTESRFSPETDRTHRVFAAESPDMSPPLDEYAHPPFLRCKTRSRQRVRIYLWCHVEPTLTNLRGPLRRHATRPLTPEIVCPGPRSAKASKTSSVDRDSPWSCRL